MQILIVDDDESIRRMLNRQLRKHGHEVLEAKSGMEAIKVMETATPNLILLDQMMPGMDGLATFEKLIKNRRTPPVIMLTAHGTLDLAVAFMKAGGTDFVNKPVDIEVLEIKIKKAVEKAMLKEKLEILEREKVQLSAMLETSAKLNHEINNPLNIIFNAVPRIKGLPEDFENLEKIRKAMFSIEQVVVDINQEVEKREESFRAEGEYLAGKIENKIGLIRKEDNEAISRKAI